MVEYSLSRLYDWAVTTGHLLLSQDTLTNEKISESLNQLKEITITSENIKLFESEFIKEDFTFLKNVETIHFVQMDGNIIESIPFQNLPNLQSVKIQGEFINFLHNNWHKLSDIEYLEINFSSNTEKIPEDILLLKKLKYLHITNYALNSLPKSLWKLSTLVEISLNVSNFFLTGESSQLLKLKKLSIGTSFTFSIDFLISNKYNFLPNLEELKIECFGKNQGFNSWIFHFFLRKHIFTHKKLISLELKSNYVSKIPERICQMSNLERLHLKLIKDFKGSHCLKNLENLKFLGISESDLEEIPSWLSHLKKLEYLSFHDTLISTIPSFVKELPNLKGIDLLMTRIDENQEVEIRETLPNCNIQFGYWLRDKID